MGGFKEGEKVTRAAGAQIRSCGRDEEIFICMRREYKREMLRSVEEVEVEAAIQRVSWYPSDGCRTNRFEESISLDRILGEDINGCQIDKCMLGECVCAYSRGYEVEVAENMKCMRYDDWSHYGLSA